MKKILAMAALSLLAGCSSTRITSVWKEPSTVNTSYGKIMVVGIIRDADRTLRQQMEHHLVNDLNTLGYQARSAYDQYGPKALEGLSEEETNKKLSREGVDAVLTIVLLDKQKERYYVPARVVYTPYIMYHRHFWGYYNSIYTRIESPGYYEVENRYFWESNLYDLHTKKLVYSVQTQSFDPSATDQLAHEYGQLIVNSMVRNGILQKQTAAAPRAM